MIPHDPFKKTKSNHTDGLFSAFLCSLGSVSCLDCSISNRTDFFRLALFPRCKRHFQESHLDASSSESALTVLRRCLRHPKGMLFLESQSVAVAAGLSVLCSLPALRSVSAAWRFADSAGLRAFLGDCRSVCWTDRGTCFSRLAAESHLL